MAKVTWHIKIGTPGWMLLAASQVLAQEHGLTLKDPTQPLGGGHGVVEAHSTVPTELVLQAIFHRAEGYEAIVNGQRVTVGDRVMGVRITRIDTNSVSYSGASIGTLTLLPRVGNPIGLQEARQ